MALKGILFDLYGTLIDIETDETRADIYRSIAHFLTYHGILLHRGVVRDHYFRLMREYKDRSAEQYPEVDVELIWETFLNDQGMHISPRRAALAKTLAQLHRGISRKRLELFPEVKMVLDELRSSYRMGIVSDAQPCYAIPELQALGLHIYFNPIIISARFGFRKPDPRLFFQALKLMKLRPEEAVFVGNDMYHDIFGARGAGMRTIFLNSSQGEQAYGDTIPDYVVERFAEMPLGIEQVSRSSH